MKTVMTFHDIIDMPEGTVIPAGTIVVIPHTTDDADPFEIPPFTIVMAGQSLSRLLYPELSQFYAGSGGFYSFELENLRKRFVLGFDENGRIIRGTAVIYYRQVRWCDEPEDRG